jgi:alcohol dehydrogenase (cytochrome c)
LVWGSQYNQRHMGNTNLRETKRNTPLRYLPRTTRHAAVLSLMVIALGVTIGGAFYWKAFSRTHEPPHGPISEKITWRVRLFARKATGGIPQLSWRELWQMARHQGGFGLEDLERGVSLDGSVRNAYDSDPDLQAASRIFNVRCAMCHGSDGAGGEHGAPPLNHAGLKHGDSDLAIYKVLRDGVPNTAMQAPSISLVQRWQLVGYVRHLQLHGTDLSPGKASLDIEVSGDRLLSAGTKTDQWLTYSGSLDGHRYTPLSQITRTNVSQLRLRWVQQFDTRLPAIEATPLVVGGVIFITEPSSDTLAVDALDAKSGDLIWRYSRSVLADVHAVFGKWNKGLAILDSNLYFASLDGYLVCINANTGKLVWETKVADPSRYYSLSMAPLIVNRSVVVGVAGGEYGIRGFLAAFDVETGKQQWQFDTIPGPGEPGHETWSGDSWRNGGGGTWVTGSYDPSLDLLYWGVGNPSPDYLGDDRLGDNLYSDSVIALRPGTGKLAWHFQFTPHDVHDWDSTQTPILADIPINGHVRKVMCWANRNGFYYVLDRATGEFLAGVPFVEQNWAKGLDSMGRPILAQAPGTPSVGRITRPGVGGGTNFQNAAFDPVRKLVFVPATETVGVYTTSLSAAREDNGQLNGSAGADIEPQIPVVRALDAATGIRKWECFLPSLDGTSYYGGLLATGGGLVFGASRGSVLALDSTTGHEIWRVFLGGDTRVAPISFTVNGRQVIAVSAGRGLFLFGL